MTIARKPPPRRRRKQDDPAAEAFIDRAPHRSDTKPKPATIAIRIDADLLHRIDTAARRRSITRSAWIKYTLSQALDDS